MELNSDSPFVQLLMQEKINNMPMLAGLNYKQLRDIMYAFQDTDGMTQR